MSVKVMGKVWDMDLPPGEKLVLLALADHADHNGNNAYPGNDLLAKKTGLSTRQVRRILDDLESRAIVKKSSGGVGRGKKANYEIITEKGTLCPLSGNKKEDTMSPIKNVKKGTFEADKRGHLEQEKGTFGTGKGDICDNPPTPPYKEEPSLTVLNRPKNQQQHVREAHSENGNGAKSKFTKDACAEFSEFLANTENRIRNPAGFAVSIYHSGEADTEIQAWIDNGKQEPKQKRKAVIPG
jgi:hypothetical protein